MRNIATLNANRTTWKVKFRLNRREALLDVLVGALLFRKRVGGVLSGQVQKTLLDAAHRGKEQRLRGTFALSREDRGSTFAQPFTDASGALGQLRHKDFVGDQCRPQSALRVVIAQETTDNLVLGKRGAGSTEVDDLHHSSLAHVDDTQFSKVALAINPQHVLADVRDGHDSLLFFDFG